MSPLSPPHHGPFQCKLPKRLDNGSDEFICDCGRIWKWFFTYRVWTTPQQIAPITLTRPEPE